MSENGAYTPPLFRGRNGALLLKIRAAPGASRDRVLGLHGDALRVAVSAPPERGKANAAIVEVVARALGLKVRNVVLESGQTAKEKLLRIEGADALTIGLRIRDLLAPAK